MRNILLAGQTLAASVSTTAAVIVPPKVPSPSIEQIAANYANFDINNDTPWACDTTFTNGVWQSTPSAKPIGGWADWRIARSLWENKTLMYTGQTFYIHEGCSITVPDENWPDISYDDDLYGFKNNADSVMFFQNGLALFGRGKVFYDTPKGYTEAVAASGGRFGYGWPGTFNTDGNNAALKPGTTPMTGYLTTRKRTSGTYAAAGR